MQAVNLANKMSRYIPDGILQQNQQLVIPGCVHCERLIHLLLIFLPFCTTFILYKHVFFGKLTKLNVFHYSNRHTPSHRCDTTCMHVRFMKFIIPSNVIDKNFLQHRHKRTPSPNHRHKNLVRENV